MSSFNKYDLGDVMTTQARWTDPHDNFAPVDPDEIYLDILTPSGQRIHYEFGDGDEIKRIEEGVYEADVQLFQSGYYYYRWSSYGSGQAAIERKVYVKDSIVAEGGVSC